MAEEKMNTMSFPWILIAGTTESPQNIKRADKVRTNGKYLDGISSDLHNMKEWVINRSSGTVDTILQDMKYLSRYTVLDRIKKTANKTESWGCVNIYYTGHGQVDTGNWCFKDGTISLKEVIGAVKSVNNESNIQIDADCCYSGNWAYDLKEYKHNNKMSVDIYAASRPGQVAYDTENGGMFSLVKSKKKNAWDFKKFQPSRGLMKYGKYKMFYDIY
eukprot:172377_1